MADNYALSYHEILMKVNNKKDKPGKLEVLRRYDTEQLRKFLKGSFRYRTHMVKTRSEKTISFIKRWQSTIKSNEKR